MSATATKTSEVVGRLDLQAGQNEVPMPNKRRLYLSREGDWYIDFEDDALASMVNRGKATIDRRPTHSVEFTPTASITVSRTVTAAEFLRFLDTLKSHPSQNVSPLGTAGQVVARTDHHSQTAPAVTTLIDSNTNGQTRVDYTEYISCPTTLGFRC
jgi:hypothetical protein